ncbi:MAG: hypothetical protein AAGF97_12550, partial [Planctomycetota bacterium]
MSTSIESATTIQNGIDHVECHRSFARRCDVTGGWKLMVRGQVVQGRPDNLRRKLLTHLLYRAMKATPAQVDSAIFQRRLESFLVLTRPKTHVAIRLGNRTLTLKKRSNRDGMFQQVLDIPDQELQHVTVRDKGRTWLGIAPVVQGDDEKDLISPLRA